MVLLTHYEFYLRFASAHPVTILPFMKRFQSLFHVYGCVDLASSETWLHTLFRRDACGM